MFKCHGGGEISLAQGRSNVVGGCCTAPRAASHNHLIRIPLSIYL